MSLIVAHCSPRGIKAVSDTRLNDPISGLPCSHFEGTLKLFVLSERLAFGFAGDPTHAWRALETCQSTLIDNLEPRELVQILREAEAASTHATEFLALSIKPTQRLYKISDGKMTESDHQLWIGDIDGFDLYQKYFHEALSKVPAEYRSSPDMWRNNMEDAMEAVIESSEVPTVGDFLVPVSSDDGSLHYVSHARIRFYPTDLDTGGGWTAMRAGTVQEGSYSATMLTVTDRKIPAVGFHFFEAKLGVLFHPQQLPKPAIFREVDVEGFIRQVAEHYGIEFQGHVKWT
jgi:hypothetical protein